MLTISIGGTDRSSLIRARSIRVESVLSSQVDTCRFDLRSVDGSYRSEGGQVVLIERGAGNKVFEGRLGPVPEQPLGPVGLIYPGITGRDYGADLGAKLVRKRYAAQTPKQIIDDILTTYFSGAGFTTTNVADGPAVTIGFNYRPADVCIASLADLIGYEWYVDYDKDIHFFPKESEYAPISLADGSTNYRGFRVLRDPTQIRNRVYVRGATYYGAEKTVNLVGNGQTRVWQLPYEIKEVSMDLNGAAVTDGVDNLTNGKDFYWTHDGRVRQDDSGTLLTDTDVLAVSFLPKIPLRVVVEDPASIAARAAIEGGDGIHEYLVVDERIEDKALARKRGQAELRMYANAEQVIRFRTFENGLRAGQLLPINLTRYDLDGNYLIRRVTLQYAGDLDTYEYAVEAVS